jgi:hypothetical protein
MRLALLAHLLREGHEEGDEDEDGDDDEGEVGEHRRILWLLIGSRLLRRRRMRRALLAHLLREKQEAA